MKLSVCVSWILAAAAIMKCDGAAVRLSWIGQGPVGDTRWGIHSKVLGGTVAPTYLPLPERTQSVTVHDGTVYYAQAPDSSYNSSNVFTTDREGGSKTPLYSINRSNTSWGFVVTDNHLYLSDSLYDTISRSNLDGSARETVFQSTPGSAPSPAYMAGTGDHLYWIQFSVSDRGRSSIWSLDHSNPTHAVSILTALSEPRYLSASSSHLFWFDSMDRVIYRTDLNGQNRQVIVASTWARGMVVDDEYVYWANNTNLLRSDHNGGNIQTILTSGSLIGSLYLEPIPEPGSLLLGSLASVVLMGRRKRQPRVERS